MANLLRQIISIETFLNNNDVKVERIVTKGNNKPTWRNVKLNETYGEANAKVYEAEYADNVEILNFKGYINQANEWLGNLTGKEKREIFWYLKLTEMPTLNQLVFEFLK
ncbi:hypothetical protein MA9V2_062 [Chryseobacterium phage MA9V-2]|nr:hypothetical protein MA9V2_062 [Chryseobacterium phage MA9V-2]